MFRQLVNIARKILINDKELLPEDFDLKLDDPKELRSREDFYKQNETLEYLRYKDYIRHGTIKDERS